MCLPGCCRTRTGAKITAVYSMLSGTWYGIQAIFAFTDNLVLDSLNNVYGVVTFLASCIVISSAGVILMSGARQLSRAKIIIWFVLFATMLSVRIVYLGMLAAEIKAEDHDVHRVMHLLGPTILTTIFLLADLWSIITVVYFIRDLRANRYSHKQHNRALGSLGKSVFAWNNENAVNNRLGGGGGGSYFNSDNSNNSGGSNNSAVLSAAQLAHLPPGLQKAYAATMASGRAFTTKDYQHLMMQYDLYESSQQQMRDKQQHQQQQQQNFHSRPSAVQQFSKNAALNGFYAHSSGLAPPGRYSLAQQQQQAAIRRLHRDSNLLYAGGGGGGNSVSSYNDDDIQWNYLGPAMTAGYLAVQCMEAATFDGGDMGSALAAVDI